MAGATITIQYGKPNWTDSEEKSPEGLRLGTAENQIVLRMQPSHYTHYKLIYYSFDGNQYVDGSERAEKKSLSAPGNCNLL